MKDIYRIDTSPFCNNNNVVKGDKYRFTVLTSQMIRLEYDDKGIFEDRATQRVLNRNFISQSFKLIDEEENLEIITDHIHLIYDKRKFSKNGLTITVRGNISNYHSIGITEKKLMI